MASDIINPESESELDRLDPGVELAASLSRPDGKFARFIFAALGSVPWIGALLAAGSALHAEAQQGRHNVLVQRWIEEHDSKLDELRRTLAEMSVRFDELGAYAEERLQDERYLSLVRQGFRTWDEATTQEKRDFVRRCLTNAAGTKLCSDDVVRIFLTWIRQYDETHFRIMRFLYHNPGSTRADMWTNLHGEFVREDSAEADLFKLLVRDLSTGSVMRQRRQTNHAGQYLAKGHSPKPAAPRRQPGEQVLESAFEDSKPYELTELGSNFLHYTVDELVPRMYGGPSAA
jgi:hypothetical protein